MTGQGLRPDVILVVLDTARTFDVSAVWPESGRTTPRLEKWAADSVSFPNATSPSCWTLPGHASLFTGLLPSEHGATELTMHLGPGPATLAEILTEAGYLAAAVSCNDLVGPATGLARGFEVFVEERESLPEGIGSNPVEAFVRRVGPLRRRVQRRHYLRRTLRDHGGARANRLLGRLLKHVDSEQPLFLFVNYLEPHLPYMPPDDLAREFLPTGVTLEAAHSLNQSSLDHYLGRVAHDADDWALFRALYQGAIRYNDHLLGELLDMLAATRRLEDAIVVVTSDHGENLGDHGLMGHQFSLNDSVLRVPLLVRLPGGRRGESSDDLVQLTDVLPTICVALGIDPPPGVGQPLTGPVVRDFVLAEYLAPHPILGRLRQNHPDNAWGPYDRGLRSIRTLAYKYIAASDGRNEFYDIGVDRYERDNLFGSHPAEARLARMLRSWEQEHGVPSLQGGEVDPSVLRRLVALGYVD